MDFLFWLIILNEYCENCYDMIYKYCIDPAIVTFTCEIYQEWKWGWSGDLRHDSFPQIKNQRFLPKTIYISSDIILM